MEKSNLLIIGSGPGGYRAALYAARHGLTVTIVEANDVGGTCLNHGCIPTKTLCRNAEIIDTLNNTDMFGIACSDYSIDFTKVIERKHNVVEQLRSGVENLMQQPGITLIHGFAHFKDKNTISVGNNEYSADNIIIATGSEPKLPPIKGIDLPGVVTSTEMLNTPSIPPRLCIIGAGVIGMEFASIFNSFGSKVTVVEYMKECLPVLDCDIAKRLRQTIAKHGVEFAMRSAVKSITATKSENGKQQLVVFYEKNGKQLQVDVDTVLVATGRKPNINGLRLEQVGVAFTDKGISVDKDFRTNIPGIFAIGDVNGKCMLAHAATSQGLHVVNMILGKADNIRFDVMPSAIFTNPEAASVGANEEQLKADGRQYECRKGFYRANGKALAMNETDGMLKLLVDTSRGNRIIGCHAFGAHSSDIIQEVTALIATGTTMDQLADIIHIHPTLSEIIHDTACQ